jgi:rhodanese-related sulfurtransferase
MPRQIFWMREVEALLQKAAQLVDVLDRDDYGHDHLPGAVNIPLKELNAATASRLDRDRPVVVYCNDFG